MKKIPLLRVTKMIYLGSFLLGFVLFWLFGKNVLEQNVLLNVTALREVKDSAIDISDFFQYIAWRRMLLFGAAVIIWWKGFEKWFVYGMFGYMGMAMGISMYTCLFRYHIKGIFLWAVLYVPQVICYLTAMVCFMLLTEEHLKDKQEKIKFIWKKWLPVIGCLAAYVLGIYAESYLNVPLLQSFLQFF